MRDDEPEEVDLALLVCRYVENFAAGCPQRRFTLRGAFDPIPVSGSAGHSRTFTWQLVNSP